MMNLRRRMIRVARQQTRYAARCFRIHGAITNQMHARRHNVITICRARLIFADEPMTISPTAKCNIIISLSRVYVRLYIQRAGAESCYCGNELL
jgi:hypothetical protein